MGGKRMVASDELKGLTDLARLAIRDVGRMLDASPYVQGADKWELRVHFWATLVALAQGQHVEELVALGTERGTGMRSIGDTTGSTQSVAAKWRSDWLAMARYAGP
jgi:hypothetical protein